jgi:tetratricopeptide (TPR) repeat protein
VILPISKLVVRKSTKPTLLNVTKKRDRPNVAKVEDAGQIYKVFCLKTKRTIFFLITAVFLLITLTLYYHTLDGPFVLDDTGRIEKNPHIRLTQLSPEDLVRVGLANYNNRPVAYISFALNYYFHRCAPFGYHLVNIVIHALAGACLYLFLTTTLKTPYARFSLPRPGWVAFLCALLWLVHPVQTQSVAYIVQRMTSLAALFFVLAFWLYVKGRLTHRDHQRRLWYGGAVITGLVSLGCKQITVTLPFFILLYEWFFFQDLSVDWLKRKSLYLLGMVLLIVFMGLAFTDFDPLQRFSRLNDFSQDAFTLSERMMTQSRVVIYYSSLLLYPVPSRLNLDYDFPLSHSLIDPVSTLFSLVAVLGLIASGLYLARRHRLISFSILWFFGNLAIESSVVPLAIIFEHRLYLPSMLVFLIPVLLVHRFVRLPALRIALSCVAIMMLSIGTYQRSLAWQNAVTLWTDVVAKSPNKVRALSSLGAALADQGNLDAAINHYQKALQIDPEHVLTHNNLGLALVGLGNLDAAINHYRKALQIDPEYLPARINWGIALRKSNQIDAAIEQFLLVLQMSPSNPEAHHYLGDAFFKKGMLDEAMVHSLEAVRLKPHFAEAYFKLGLFSAEGGQTEKAIGYYRQALSLKPDFAEAHINLGHLLAERGKLHDALWHYQQAKEYDPAMEAADLHLAQAYVQQGDADKAIGTLRALLKLKPDSAEAHHRLALLLAQKGDYDGAGTHYTRALNLNPRLAKAHYNYGNLKAQKGAVAEAAEHYRAALALDPGDAEARSNLGNILAMEGRMEEAIDHFLKALHHDPDLVAARSNLIKAYVLSGDHHAALEQMEILKQLDPEEAARVQERVTNQPQQ